MLLLSTVFMNIEVIEMKNNKDNSIFCGTLHYESKALDDTHLSHYPKRIPFKQRLQTQIIFLLSNC